MSQSQPLFSVKHLIALGLGVGLGAAGLVLATLALTQPYEPATFSALYDVSGNTDRAISVYIRQGGGYTVRCVPAVLERASNADCETSARSGFIAPKDVMNLRHSIRAAGFYRWKTKHAHWSGGADFAKLCVSEAGKTRCVQVRISDFPGSEVGPPRLWLMKETIFELVHQKSSGAWH